MKYFVPLHLQASFKIFREGAWAKKIRIDDFDESSQVEIWFIYWVFLLLSRYPNEPRKSPKALASLLICFANYARLLLDGVALVETRRGVKTAVDWLKHEDWRSSSLKKIGVHEIASMDLSGGNHSTR